MTAYKNFVQDFPNRCMDVFKLLEKQAKNNDREVTLALMVASAGFVIPFERLRPLGEINHPTRDREKFPDYASSLQQLMEAKFIGSELHPKKSNWFSGKLKSIDGDPDSWPELNKKTMPSDKTVGNVLKTIRNALSHGNILTKDNPISQIIFVSVNRNTEEQTISDYSFVSVSPEDFLTFLKCWFRFLENKKISQYEVVAELENAA
jgi:hypothetical protein